MSTKTPAVIAACASTVLAVSAIIGLTAAAQEYVLGKERDVAIELHALSANVSALERGQNDLAVIVAAFEQGQNDLVRKVTALEEGQNEFAITIAAFEQGQNDLAVKVVALEEGQNEIRENMLTQKDLEEAIAQLIEAIRAGG
ncbi:MAG: hypothetical protein OXC91_11110 [Rhodobacteraceae bacterium]|nr:hypothetical protein [Paracoccaceae bacterium]